jgi:hypothetical protein
MICRLSSGLAVCADLGILASLPLPIAGLLCPGPLDTGVSQYETAARMVADVGSLPPDRTTFAVTPSLSVYWPPPR